ncbi:DUF4012 domain-containing protein [Paramicrobacterium agarici]|uniref:DUF4012 domain-containing protein n=1 Tax=Paramicrobacterium agarici TaxID=630514 RepID=UPI00116A8003|nr:DUF4012 domain-containing protein [Microbacterium agarici]TQO23697.1 uncharacterized protein DUF4012 [Microbacterium agarici]
MRKKPKPLLKSARLWVPVGFLCALVGAAAVLAAILIPRALQVRDELVTALPLASQVQAELISGDNKAAEETAANLREHTQKAAELTEGRSWAFGESLPFVGANLSAVRTVAQTVDRLAERVLVPATGISLDLLKPVDGRIDVEKISALGTLASSFTEEVSTAKATLEAIDTSPLVDQVGTKVEELSNALNGANDVLHKIRAPLAVLPSVLGGEGERNYLMIFQGNSEVRAAGGNPAAMILIRVDDGRISIANQTSSSDFLNSSVREPVMKLDPEVSDIYSDIVGMYIPNITSTPDFPTTAALMEAYWHEEFSIPLDGIVSFDPVGLSYLLQATGPVELPTGDRLTSENAVPLLLNEAYFRYPQGEDSNAFFATAASAVFETLMSGAGDPKGMYNALVKSADENRLMMWSPHEDIAALIAGTDLQGVLPADNSQETTVGVYFNDTTGSKMDYYVDAKIEASTNQCDVSSGESPTFKTDVTLTNSITREEAMTLPGYITGPYYKPGDIATDFVVYGPVGAKIDSWLVNGNEHSAKATGEIDGRPVVRLNYVLKPGESVTVSYTMTGAPDQEYGEFTIDTTPMVRDTPITITGCKPEDTE